jgi:hypothetical protein
MGYWTPAGPYMGYWTPAGLYMGYWTPAGLYMGYWTPAGLYMGCRLVIAPISARKYCGNPLSIPLINPPPSMDYVTRQALPKCFLLTNKESQTTWLITAHARIDGRQVVTI